MKVICDNCKKEFDRKDYLLKKAIHHFCCKKCYKKYLQARKNTFYNDRSMQHKLQYLAKLRAEMRGN